MQKQCLVIVFLLLLSTICLCGCTQPTDDADKFIGTWITETKTNPMSGDNYNETRVFYANGSYMTTNMGIGQTPGVWRLAEGKLMIDTYYPGTYQYTFSQNNTVLILRSDATGISENLTKQ